MTEDPAPGRDGPSEAIGLVYEEIGAELARGRVPVTDVILQIHGLVHGGIYPLIAESIASKATGDAVAADGNVAMGQSISASFLRPITEGTVYATARRRHAGRTTWTWDVEIADDDGRLCALARMTIAVRPRPDA